MTGTSITLTGVTKTFGDAHAVRDLSAVVAAGSFTALLGPSGCGKSTTLAMIAGLQQPDSGDIAFDGRSQLAVRTEHRPAGLVFQKPLLFPHLTVEQNVAFGLRMRGLDRARTRTQVAAMLDRVQLGALGRRRVGELSGGQEQRVSLARALVLRPQVLLLDEPFSQLDAALRAEMRDLITRLHRESRVTTVLVTHDQAEAVEVADTILLMLDGRPAGHGAPELFYTAPPSLAAARFFGVTNELPGVVRDGLFTAADAVLRRETTLRNGRAVLVVRPEALAVHSDTGAPGSDAVTGGLTDTVTDTATGVVTEARFAGTHVVVRVALPTGRELTVHTPVGGPVRPGAPVTLRIGRDAGTVLALPVETSGG